MQEEQSPPTIPTDTLNEIGVLKRREIEARILAPLIEALSEEFGSQRVLPIVREVVGRIAKEQGEALANSINGRSLVDFAGALDAWRAGNALEIQPLENNDRRLSFNVTRCRYAELYRSLGIPELGALLSCHRDFSLIDGFNPSIQLARTQTIMEGASHCDFRFTVKELPQP
jgi:hypothetical protein